MKIYDKPEKAPEVKLPTTPKTFAHAEIGLREWTDRIPDLLSSPSIRRFNSFVKGTSEVLASGYLKEWEYKILSDRVAEQQKKKKRSRRVIQKGGVLHVGEAWAQIAERDRKEAEEIQRKADFAAKKEASKA